MLHLIYYVAIFILTAAFLAFLVLILMIIYHMEKEREKLNLQDNWPDEITNGPE